MEGGGRPPLPPKKGGGSGAERSPIRPESHGGKRVRGDPSNLDPRAPEPLPPAGSSDEGFADKRSRGDGRGGAGGGRKKKGPGASRQPQQKQPPDPRIVSAAMAFSLPQQPQQQQQRQHHQLHFQFQPQPQPQSQPQPQPQMQQPQPQFQFQMMQPQAQPPHQQPMFLFKVDKSPASYNTKWGELHPDSQKCLLGIEARISEHRSASQRLDENTRLYDSSAANNGFELDATYILKELKGISIAMDREKCLAKMMMTSEKDMMRSAQLATDSFIGTSNFISQPMANSARVNDFYIGVPKRPSQFFIKTVVEFENHLAECRRWIEESEQLLHVDTGSTSGSFLEYIPSILSNEWDYFICVAAKVENLHQYIESMKTTYLADRRRQGDANDPFLEADRRETAKREVAARRVHPTLHAPAIPSQPSSQAPGLFTTSAILGGSTVVPRALGNFGVMPGGGFAIFSTPSTAASASGFSIFSTLSTAASASASLFSTPPSSAARSTLFSSSVFSPQSTHSGSTQTRSLFGAYSPAFTSTLATGSSQPFSMPSFAPGAALELDASPGAPSKAAKLKKRAAEHQ